MCACMCICMGIAIVYIVAVRQPIVNIKAAWSGTKLSGLMCEMLCCTALRSRIQLMLSIQSSKDGQLRICGDYKVTVNQALKTEQYPLPKPSFYRTGGR